MAASRDSTYRHEHLQAAFRRYVSPQLADRILDNAHLRDGVPAPDIRARAVVMFADLRGFTGLAERLRPAEVVPLLNDYFSLLTDITFRHGGTVFHMAGDCLMAAFGVPLPQPDGPQRALAAAREMLAGFGDLAERWRARLGVTTGLGVGINEGEVVAGNVGSATFMHYTIIGDTVNVAARLCQRARAGEMVLARPLKQWLDEHGLPTGALELPAMTLKGRSTPIDICCVPTAARLAVADAASGVAW